MPAALSRGLPHVTLSRQSFAAVALPFAIGVAAFANPIDLQVSWKFRPQPDSANPDETWASPALNDADWDAMDAGKPWEELGYKTLDGYAWYRKRVAIPETWQGKPVWLVLGAVNDACVVYCNGKRAGTYGNEGPHSMYLTPVIADLSPHAKFGEDNVIAIRVFDWGGNGGIWRAPVKLSSETVDLPAGDILYSAAEFDPIAVRVDVDLHPFPIEWADATVRGTLGKADGADTVATVEARPYAQAAILRFPLAAPTPGARYRIKVDIAPPAQVAAAPIALETTFTWPDAPAWPKPYDKLRVLNNFVTELLRKRIDLALDASDSFLNPRDGWVMFSLTAEPGVDWSGFDPQLQIDHEQDKTMTWRNDPETGRYEAMRWLKKGRHAYLLRGAPGVQLDIRAVPEIAYCYYPTQPHIKAFGPYDWAYMNRHILPHVNAIVARSEVPPTELEEWRRQDRIWIGNAGLPGLHQPAPPSPRQIYETWRATPGATRAGYGGIIVDEFVLASEAHYAAWKDAIGLLLADPLFDGRTFYAWCIDIYREPFGADFSRFMMENGQVFSWEKYLREGWHEHEARETCRRELSRPMQRWKETTPGIERNLIMCLGYFSAPPETLNVYPWADYHVFLDIQMHLLATDPLFFGMRGIMEYMADYADEESVRYAHRLFRHYCIEGRTDRMNTDPYLLPHLKNPDFAEGLDAWRAEPAEPGSIAVKKMEGFSFLEGRYPRTTDGDQFCWMRRGANAPNRVRQTMTAFEPGRLYSLKAISADLKRMDVNQTVSLGIEIGNAEHLPAYDIEYTVPSSYAHPVGPYNNSHPAHITFRRIVFRPDSATCELVISDWKSSTEPGGEIGQETIFNFVEVQPFHAP